MSSDYKAILYFRNKERALEEADEKHEAEIKIFNEKIKHLIYEHECRLTEVKVRESMD